MYNFPSTESNLTQRLQRGGRGVLWEVDMKAKETAEHQAYT